MLGFVVAGVIWAGSRALEQIAPRPRPAKGTPMAADPASFAHKITAPTPRTRTQARQLMVAFGYGNYKLDAFDGDRLFLISPKQLGEDKKMKTRAYTLMLEGSADDPAIVVGVSLVTGWVVVDPA